MDISDKTEFTYTAILKDIIRNVYDQSSIITEKSLLNKYQVSRSPVREALLMPMLKRQLLNIYFVTMIIKSFCKEKR